MKKLLGIVALGLLLSGKIYADPKIDKALENCADDDYYMLTKVENLPSSLYSSNIDYQKFNKENEELKLKIKKLSDEELSKLQKWYDENPHPKRSEFKQITTSIGTLEWPGYDDALEKRYKAQREFVIEITKEKKLLTIKQKKLEKKIETIISVSAYDYIKHSGLSLKTKAKSVAGYLDYYKNCEIKYKSTPSSFMLEWGN